MTDAKALGATEWAVMIDQPILNPATHIPGFAIVFKGEQMQWLGDDTEAQYSQKNLIMLGVVIPIVTRQQCAEQDSVPAQCALDQLSQAAQTL